MTILPKSRLSLTIGVLGIALGIPVTVSVAQNVKTVINAITITSYPPFSSRDTSSNKLVGFDIDIVEAIADILGSKVNWMESSWNQMTSFSDLKTKRADLTTGIGDTAERRESANFVDHYSDAQVIYTLRANMERIPSQESLCGKKVGISRSSRPYADALQKLNDEKCVATGKPALVVVLTEGPVESRLQMMQGRIDASMSGAATLAQLNVTEGGKFVSVGAPLASYPIGLAFGQDDLQFGLAIKEALNKLIVNGTYDKLLRKWNLPEITSIKKATINTQP